MTSFQETCASLESLQTFDPEAFKGDDRVPQKLCNFALALALIYNDCKNTTYAVLLLKDCKPEGKLEINAVQGAWSGIHWHLFRLMISAVHELFTLIQEHQDVLNHEFLQKVVRQLNSTSRESWSSLTAAAIGATPKDDFGRMLLRIRNQMVFHYDPKGVFAGFKKHFLDPERRQDRAFISRGLSMEATRFYFADAAVEGYFRETVGDGEVGQIAMKIRDVVDSLNYALLSLIDRFIQQRGFAYRSV